MLGFAERAAVTSFFAMNFPEHNVTGREVTER